MFFCFDLFSEQNIEKMNISKVMNKFYPERKVEILPHSFNNYWLVRLFHSEIVNDELLILIKKKNGKYKIQEIKFDEKYIVSARLIKLTGINNIFIELFSSTEAGNGYLYICDTNLDIKLKTKAYDSHQESKEYYEFHKSKLFHNRPYTIETISAMYKNYQLNVKYLKKPVGRLIVFGFCDYFLESENKDLVKIIFSEKVEKYYQYSAYNGKFKYLKNISKDRTPDW